MQGQQIYNRTFSSNYFGPKPIIKHIMRSEDDTTPTCHFITIVRKDEETEFFNENHVSSVERDDCDFPISGGYFINFSDRKNLTKRQCVLMPLWRMTTIDII